MRDDLKFSIQIEGNQNLHPNRKTIRMYHYSKNEISQLQAVHKGKGLSLHETCMKELKCNLFLEEVIIPAKIAVREVADQVQ